MRRPRPTRYNSWSTVGMMGAIPQSPQSPTKMRPRSRDTGFPEPFCGNRNTTLPHPDADLSPNACISADDVSVNKVLHRSRRSFLAKHKRTISYGKILPDMEAMHSNDSAIILESDGESPRHDKHPHHHHLHLHDHSSLLDVGRPSKDGGDSIGSSSLHGDDGDKLNLPDMGGHNKRRSVLRKLRLTK